MEKIAYLDYNSAAPVLPKVLENIRSLLNLPLNPSAQHSLGQKAFAFLENTRDTILNSLGCQDNFKVAFTASGTEANNLIIKGIEGIDHYICSTVEHKSVLEVIKAIPKLISKPSAFSLIPVTNTGEIRLEMLLEILEQNKNSKVLLSLMHANNETGVLTNLKDVIAEARKIHQNLVIHSDMAQSIGKVPINLIDLDLDAATIISYKIGGLSGAAALIFKKDLNLEPLLFGGMQEDGLRPGTENVISIVSLGLALELVIESLGDFRKVELMRNNFESKIKTFNQNATFFGSEIQRVGNTSFFAIPKLSSQHLLVEANRQNIALGVGASCSAGLDIPSHVLKSLGVSDDLAKCAIRMSLGHSTKEEHLQRLEELISKLLL